MKKFLLILSFTFLFFFIFIPNDVKAYTISSDITEEEITCNSDDDEYCKSLGYKYAYYYNDAYLDGNNGSYYILTNSTLWFAPGHQSSVEVGPPTTYPSYIYKLGSGNSLKYSFEKGKIYRIYYNFRFPKELTLSMGDTIFQKDYSSFEVSDSENIYKDWSEIFKRYSFGFLGPEADESTQPFNFTFYFEFEPIISFNSLKFAVGTDHFNNDYHHEFISNFWTSGTGENQTLTSNVTYTGIRVVETSSFLSSSGVDHGGGGASFDQPSKADESIFDNLDVCEPMDFGCHFNNLLTMLKNVFTRIGNFFTSVFNFFNDGINTVLKWFYDNFLAGPIEATLIFFGNMVSTKILGVDIFFDKLEELVQPSDDGITSIITAPLSYIKSLNNGSVSCTQISLPLVSWFNKDLILPCPSTIYSKFGSFLTIYQTITSGIIAYWCLVNILSLTLQFKEPFSDKIEVMDL